MSTPAWIWIPIILAAAGAQTVRNAAQRSLTKSVGTLASTCVRFLYGLPFALLGLLAVRELAHAPLPSPTIPFAAWVTIGAVGQLVGTAFLLAAMEQRSFIVAVAYSKTEVLQVALLSVLLLHDPVSWQTVLAILLATCGVIVLSMKGASLRTSSPSSWLSPTALLGLASGAGFAISAVGFRAALLALGDFPAWFAGVYGLVWAQAIQTALLCGYLALRNRTALRQIIVAWRISLLAGFAGAFASMCWFTAFAMRSAADVRTLGLVEVLYGYAASSWIFHERTTGREAVGIVLLLIGIVIVAAQW